MNINGTLTPEGQFTGTLVCDKAEQQQWLEKIKAGQPEGSPLRQLKRLALHNSEVEVDVGGVPLLGTVTADVVLKAEDG